MHVSNYDLAERVPGTRRLMFRGGLLLAGVLMISGLAGWTRRVRASNENVAPSLDFVAGQMRALNQKLQLTEGDLAVARIQVQRADAILKYSTRYQIPADVAAAIYDISLSEGIDPSIGFRLVKIESNFDPRAHSSAGAVGYTQIRLATARFFEPSLTPEQLYDREINLRLGFRFLRTLTRQYDNDISMALVAYNRGPARVQAILDRGGDPANGYAQAVLQGAWGKVGNR